MHGFVDDFYCMFLCADAARAVIAPPMIAPATLGYRAQKVCYDTPATRSVSRSKFCYPSECIALALGKSIRAVSYAQFLLSVYCCCTRCTPSLPSASDVGFGAAGVEKAAGGRLPHAHWGNGRPGGEANVRNRRDVRLPIEAHAALRHAL